jgi:hypothetical protein
MFMTAAYTRMSQNTNMAWYLSGTYSLLFIMASPWIWRAAAKAADAVSTIWPPMEIHPVNHAAADLFAEGARAATQWY